MTMSSITPTTTIIGYIKGDDFDLSNHRSSSASSVSNLRSNDSDNDITSTGVDILSSSSSSSSFIIYTSAIILVAIAVMMVIVGIHQRRRRSRMTSRKDNGNDDEINFHDDEENTNSRTINQQQQVGQRNPYDPEDLFSDIYFDDNNNELDEDEDEVEDYHNNIDDAVDACIADKSSAPSSWWL